MRRMSRLAGVTILAFLAGATVVACRADELATRLAPHVGTTIDLVELGTGRRFVRPTLERVVEKQGRAVAIRVRPEGERAAITISLPGIVRIVAARDTIHRAEAAGGSWAQLRGKRARETYEQGVAASLARMQARGVEPWPTLSAAEHARAVEDLRAFVDRIRDAFPSLAVHETHEFLVATDIPSSQVKPIVADLDAMHDSLCDLYGIPRGEPVWQGKCLVVAFLREDDYTAFESRFMNTDTRGTQGMCHQRSDGRVITACHRGTDPAAFAHMLVHETSHGFNHRWVSPQRLPNWLNEGIAEWVGARVVRGGDQVPLKEARAAAFMRSSGGVGPAFFTAENIEPVQYGIASGIVRFLITRDAEAFAVFVRSIKEGESVEAALAATFGGSLKDLLAAYGASIGVRGLAAPRE